MRLRLVFLLLPFLLASCATIFNGKTYLMKVCAIQPNSSLTVYDSTYRLPEKIKLKRSIDDLPVTLKTDSIQKEFVLKASPTRTTVFANLPYMYLMPIAYAVDHYTKKRYYYGQDIVLDANDSQTTLNKGFFPAFGHRVHDYFQRPYPGKKGQVNVIIGSPFQNNLYMDNAHGAKDYNFFGGVKSGLEYFYKDNKYWSLTAGYTRGVVFKRLGASDDSDYGEAYVDPHSLSFELKNNYAYKRLTFGYGINYSINSLKYGRILQNERERGYTQDFESNYHNYTAGLAMSTHLRFHNQMFFGVNYRPSLLLMQHTDIQFRYEHLISLELLYKLRIKK
jgi:hypothetical protein